MMFLHLVFEQHRFQELVIFSFLLVCSVWCDLQFVYFAVLYGSRKGWDLEPQVHALLLTGPVSLEQVTWLFLTYSLMGNGSIVRIE